MSIEILHRVLVHLVHYNFRHILLRPLPEPPELKQYSKHFLKHPRKYSYCISIPQFENWICVFGGLHFLDLAQLECCGPSDKIEVWTILTVHGCVSELDNSQPIKSKKDLTEQNWPIDTGCLLMLVFWLDFFWAPAEWYHQTKFFYCLQRVARQSKELELFRSCHLVRWGSCWLLAGCLLVSYAERACASDTRWQSWAPGHSAGSCRTPHSQDASTQCDSSGRSGLRLSCGARTPCTGSCPDQASQFSPRSVLGHTL